MWPNNSYLFLILCLVFLGSCKKEEIIIYPIVINQTIHNQTFELSLVNTSIVDLRIRAGNHSSLTRISAKVTIEIVNPYWKVINEDKIHYTCIDTETGGWYDYVYSCDSSSESSLYEVVKLYQNPELAELNTTNTFSNDSILLVHSYSYMEGGGPYNPTTSFTKSCFTEFSTGYFIFQNDDGERLKLSVTGGGSAYSYSITLKELDKL